jgi:hypothetical protein
LACAGHVGVEGALPARGAGHQRGQVVVGLRPDHHVDLRARDDLLALGLRDAACDRDHRGAALRRAALRSRPMSE